MIIGLNGKIGSGKDTVADFLVAEYGFTKVGYSDVLYEAVCELWDISLEQALDFKDEEADIKAVLQGRNTSNLGPSFLEISLSRYSWREFLQRFGTEMGRHVFGDDFWVEQFNRKYLEYEHHMPDNTMYVVRDVRFNNEARNIIDFGGDIWQIQRPGYEGDGHVSEAGLDEGWIKGDICNDGTIDELYTVLDEWMAKAYELKPV